MKYSTNILLYPQMPWQGQGQGCHLIQKNFSEIPPLLEFNS